MLETHHLTSSSSVTGLWYVVDVRSLWCVLEAKKANNNSVKIVGFYGLGTI